MSTPAIEGLGWIATALFVGSYFFVRPVALRTMQILGATLWVIYGALIGSLPMWYIGGYAIKADPAGAAANGILSQIPAGYVAMVCVDLYGFIYCATSQGMSSSI